MDIEIKGNNVEIGSEELNLPEDFKGISNERDFVNVYDDIKSWYGDDFSDNEKTHIREIREDGCKGFNGEIRDKKRIISNRIDKYIFESRNTDFSEIDKDVIRKINNASRQRLFRQIAIDLKNELNISNFSKEEQHVIKIEFNNAKNSNKTPDIDNIIKVLQNMKRYNASEYGIPSGEIPLDSQQERIDHTSGHTIDRGTLLSSIEISDMRNVPIAKLGILPTEIRPGQREEIQNNIGIITGVLTNNGYYIAIKNSRKYDIDQVILEAVYESSVLESPSSGELYIRVFDRFNEIDPTFLRSYYVDVVDTNDNELFWDESDFTEDDKKDIEFLVKEKGFDEEHAKGCKAKCNFLLKKKERQEELTEEEQLDLFNLLILFGEDGKGGYARRLRKLKELENLQIRQTHEFTPRSARISAESTTGNIKDIEPMAIIENNQQIKNYVYGDREIHGHFDVKNINISREDTKRLLKKLKEQKKGDPVFIESIKYLNDDLTINENLVNLSGVDMESVKENQKMIENMVNDLAVQENLEKCDKDTIKKVNIKRSSMVCCFRAISQFFNTVNNNGENFASEFEIEDVNKNIEFDEKTGIITMTGTIGANKNHIGLYYNTQTGELSFDNFLALDPEMGYMIGRGNGATEKLNIKLPTMKDMEDTANSINFDLIDTLSLNMNHYNRMVGLAMRESIWFNCFKGFMGADMEINRSFVEQFNEKNILKQDIIKNIYSKFYNQNDITEKLNNCLIVGEGNEPEQFKLIKLISDSIDYYENANQLLQFRNYINKLDELLSSKNIVKKDQLLTELFANDLSTNSDVRDNSIETIKNENEGLSIREGDNNTYEYYGNESKQHTSGNLNYYIFLNLLAENKGDKRIINLNEFKNSLNNIERTDRDLLANASSLFKSNYEDYNRRADVASLENKMESGDYWNTGENTYG